MTDALGSYQRPGRDGVGILPMGEALSDSRKGYWYEEDADDAPMVPPRPSWHAQGLCRDRSDWYELEPWEAIPICAGCPSLEPCRLAGERERHGVWGGIDRDAHRAQLARDRIRDAERRASRRDARDSAATVTIAMRGSSVRSEQSTHNRCAAGSNPARATILEAQERTA